jgi:hypothetical protein
MPTAAQSEGEPQEPPPPPRQQQHKDSATGVAPDAAGRGAEASPPAPLGFAPASGAAGLFAFGPPPPARSDAARREAAAHAARSRARLHTVRDVAAGHFAWLPGVAGSTSRWRAPTAPDHLSASVKSPLPQVALERVAPPDAWSSPARSRLELLARSEGPFAHRRAAAAQTRVPGEDVQDAGAQCGGRRAGAAAHVACQAAPAEGIDPSAAAATLRERQHPADCRHAGPDPQHDMAAFAGWAAAEVLRELARAGGAHAAGQQGAVAPASGGSQDWGPLSLDAGSAALEWPELLAGRRPAGAALAPAAAAEGGTGRGGSKVAVAYRPTALLPDLALHEHGLAARGLVVVWDVASGSGRGSGGGAAAPVVALVCEAAPAACCYGAGTCARVVVAATDDGALCAWDLEEGDETGSAAPGQAAAEWAEFSGHSGGGGTSRRLALRRPSFCSATGAAAGRGGGAGEGAADAALEPPIVIAAAAPSGSAGATSRFCGGGCSLVVLGTWGLVSVWSARRLPAAEAAVAEAHPGVRPGGGAPSENWGLQGVLQLQRQSTTAHHPPLCQPTGSRLVLVQTQECVPLGAAAAPRHALRLPGPQQQPQQLADPGPACCCSTCLELLPGPGQELLVGTAGGTVLRGARAGAPPPPREFRPEEGRLPLRQLPLNAGAAGDAGGVAAGGTACGSGGAAAIGAAVRCLAACPSRPDAFLVGCADGSLSLHVLAHAAAVRVWRGAAAAAIVGVG